LKFRKVYGDSPPSFSTINKWAAEFKRGRTSLEDDPREGRPKSATTLEIIEKVPMCLACVDVLFILIYPTNLRIKK
jgi:transposase